MAENNQQNLIGVNILYQGLNMDETPLAMPQGDYSYALNLAMQNLQGSASQATNYPGNYICTTLPAGYMIIGSQKINTGYIIFSCKLDGSSQIGLLENCTYTILVNDPCLGFTITHQIQSTYKETYNCGRRIYWTDNLNARRFLDIDHIPYTNQFLKTIDCDATLVQPNIDYPCVWYYEIQETGGLHAGMYKPYIQYADVNGIGYGDWFESIGNIPIFKDPVNSNFNSLQGSPSNEPTTKSINFLLSNIDTSYTHINIGVLTTHAGILAAYKVATIPSTSTNYLFTSTITSNVIDLTLDELLKQSTIYKKAKTVCQSNGYLLWGNLSGRKDPNFQPLANDIQVTWQTYQVPAYFTFVDSKSPYTTTFKKGFMRDEVYALGIRLVYKDGSKSCAYHIPGRKIDHRANGDLIVATTDQYLQPIVAGTWDSGQNVWYGTGNFDNFDNGTAPLFPRYKIYNTGFQSEIDSNYDSNFYGGQCYSYGQMAYWESGLRYPTTTDEAGNLIYPNDGAGTMDFIRHHKMPDASITPLFNDAPSNSVYDEPKLNYLGLNIDNVLIDYNDPEYADVIGWELVVGDRTGNKSIIAKGLLYNTMEAVTSLGNMAFPTNMYNDAATYQSTGEAAAIGVRKDVFTFYSPDTSFKKSNLTVNEIKQEREYYGTAIRVNSFSAPTAGDYGTWVGSYNLSINPLYHNVRRKIEGITYAQSNSYLAVTQFDLPLYNVHRVSSVYLQTAEGVGGAGSEMFNLPVNVDNSHPYNFGGTIGGLRDGVNISSFYASLKLNQVNQYNQLDNIDYLSIGMCPESNLTYQHCIFGGDTFLSNFTYYKLYDGSFYSTTDAGGNFVSGGLVCTDNLDDSEYPPNAAIVNSWVESSINTELRYSGTLPNESFFNTFSISNPISYTDWFTAVSCAGDNSWLYNFDYSSQNIGKYICSQSIENRTDCEPHYKTRVIYTLRSQEESKEDNWLIERPNDFYDFPKKSGELWDMRELGQDKVLFRFENGIYAYTAYDTLETDANTIQIGTGGIFAQDPRELITTDLGYGGTRSQWAANSTEFGHFFLDDKRGNVFNLKDSINPISNVKMINFFSKNLSLKLLETFPNFANFDNPANPEGIGFNSVFDDKFKIWLLSKKDYTPVLDSSGLPLVSYQKGKFYKIGARLEEVFLNDPTYFCNKSFTIGYSPKTNRWISFYSFIPMNYLSENQGFMSSVHDKLTDITKIWKHHSDKFCSYYGTGYEHIIEFPVKLQGEVTNKTSIQFITDAYDNNGYEFQNETFKKAIVYNNEEITGVLNLRVPNNNNLSTVLNLPQINLTDIDVSLENANKMIYKFNYLWNHSSDRRINNPFFYSSCTPSIDKDINLSSVNYQKNWFELARISGQWAKCRLFYDNTDINLVTTLVLSKNTTDYF